MRVIMISKRGLIVSVLIVLALIALIVVLITTSGNDNAINTGKFGVVEEYELAVATARKRELPVYSVERSDKKIALTIDAAWEDDKTDFILSELSKSNVSATFFLCGFWAEKYPEKVKAISEAGHEIGNHSATHPHMNSQSSAQIEAELDTYDDMIEKIIGKRCTLFRAPYGEYNDNVITTSRKCGYEVIQWSIDTIDWREERSAQTIIDTVIPKLAPGAIILCHNNGFKIKEYLPTLIAQAKEQGYEFVTVSELLLTGETMIDANGVQKPAQ